MFQQRSFITTAVGLPYDDAYARLCHFGVVSN